MDIEFVDPETVDGPINIVPETWNDEKPHKLIAEWDEDPCWCDPLTEGKYVHHRSVFDAIEGLGS